MLRTPSFLLPVACVLALAPMTFAADVLSERPPELTPIPTFKLANPDVSIPADGLPKAATPRSALRVWVDQIGYRATGRKLLIVGSSAAVPESPNLELVDLKTGNTVWKLSDHADAYKIWNGNKKDGESGDYVAQLDLSAFQTPGRYYVKITNGETVERSYLFNIADHVYLDAGRASWKSFYFQRSCGEKPEKYAGPWNDTAQYMGENQSPGARLYKWGGARWFEPVGKEVADPTPRNVCGGWWDAGNFDLYIGNTTNCHIRMLLGVQLTGKTPDDDLNIPESGNGIPDILDETRVGTEFFMRMADDTGSTFGRLYQQPECPPSKSKTPCMLTAQSSGATMNRAANLAYAAVVWNEFGVDREYAKKCLDESLKSWKLLEEKPHPWPVQELTITMKPGMKIRLEDKDAKIEDLKPDMALVIKPEPDPAKARDINAYPAKSNPFGLNAFVVSTDPAAGKIVFKKMAYTGEWFTADFTRTRLLAAACYFRLTGDQNWNDIMKEPWGKFDGGSFECQAAAWVYVHTNGADPELAKKMKDAITGAADGIAKSSGPNRAYGAGLSGYGWGSNQAIGSLGQTCTVAAELTDDPAAKQKYIDAAEEFIHYLHGRNPLGWCYATNMRPFGAEHATCIMFHSWFGNPGHQGKNAFGYKYIDEGPDKLGPPPAYIVGGANGGMRNYNNSLNNQPWVWNENCLGYQGQCTALIGYFGYKIK